MSSPNKSTGDDHKEDNGEPEEQQRSDQSGLSDNFETDDSNLCAENTLSPKRQSGLISGEGSNLEGSSSAAKKPKQDVSPQRQKRNSTSGENDSSGGSASKKAKEAADSIPVSSPSRVQSPTERPCTPQQSLLSPVTHPSSPILHSLLNQSSGVSAMSGMSARTGNLAQPLSTDNVTQTQSNSPESNPAIAGILNRPPIIPPRTESVAENRPESSPTESVTRPQGNSSSFPTIVDILAQPPIITPPPSLSAAIGTKISNPEVKSDPLSCGAQGVSDFTIPPQTSGHHNATEPMNESVSDPTATKDEPDKEYPSGESSPKEVGFEGTTKDENISSPQSSSLAIAAPEPGVPSSQPVPPEAPEVSQDDSTAENSVTSDRLQKMSDNLKGIKLEDSSKSTPGRRSKRVQETKKSSGDAPTSAPEASRGVDPEGDCFKKPSVPSMNNPKIKSRMGDINLQDRDVGHSPRRSARNQSKESSDSSKESVSLQKEKEGRNSGPQPGSRAASDGRTEESGKSKSHSRERIEKMKTESGSRERVKTEGETSKTRSREGTPKPKKKDASQTGSREGTSSGDGVANRTRSNQSRTASSNSETEKTEEDENETVKGKRKSRKDSSK